VNLTTARAPSHCEKITVLGLSALRFPDIEGTPSLLGMDTRAQFCKARNPGTQKKSGDRRIPYFPGPETKADGALTSYSSPQPTLVTSDLAPHFKFVHDCPGTGSKEELIEN
jgi:hypothetical protein